MESNRYGIYKPKLFWGALILLISGYYMDNNIKVFFIVIGIYLMLKSGTKDMN